MRTPLIAGNWKMNKTVAEARRLVNELTTDLGAVEGVETLLCPPYPSLLALAEMLKGTGIALGAQNMHWEDSGAYTGEVSPLMLAELCQYVILGHSERRAYFGETDETVNRRVKAALAHGLKPVVCVGETLEENEAGQTQEVVSRQLRDGLAGLDLAAGEKLIIAYEPVWAIGNGRASTAEGANAVIAEVIRPTLAEVFDASTSQAIRTLYGGSVKAANAAEYFSMPDIDGALVGGASLKAEEFVQIAKAAMG